jgi:hypothetical protein
MAPYLVNLMFLHYYLKILYEKGFLNHKELCVHQLKKKKN